MMQENLTALVDELKRLKRSGVAAVPVSDAAMAALRAAVGQHAATSAPPPAVVRETKPSAPDATAASFSNLVQAADRPAIPASRARPSAAAVSAAPPAAARELPAPPVVQLPAGTKREQWTWLRQRVLDCPVCRAHTHGEHQVVFGVGNIDADIFLCGEAPGGEEEIQGEPFIGPAGQLLTRMIVAMGLKRDDVYIGNILNWRPEMEGRKAKRSVEQTGNRPPTEEEMSFCLPYLRAQIGLVQPKAIVALGATAAKGLLGSGAFSTLGSMRGRWLDFQGTPLMVTYHPSYLLRYADNKTKRMVWEDLLMVMERVGLTVTEKQRGFFR